MALSIICTLHQIGNNNFFKQRQHFVNRKKIAIVPYEGDVLTCHSEIVMTPAV